LADENNSEKKIQKREILDAKFKANESSKIIQNLYLEMFEEELTDEGAIELYNLLFNSKPNPEKKRFVKEALELFPQPDKPTDIDIDL